MIICLVSLFNGISTPVSYFMPKPFLLNSNGNIWPLDGGKESSCLSQGYKSESELNSTTEVRTRLHRIRSPEFLLLCLHNNFILYLRNVSPCVRSKIHILHFNSIFKNYFSFIFWLIFLFLFVTYYEKGCFRIQQFLNKIIRFKYNYFSTVFFVKI